MTVEPIAIDAPISFERIVSSPTRDPAEALAELGAILTASGAIDQRTLDRARRVAAETGGRLDQVLTQLGLVSERGLADALSQLIGAPLVALADYPEAPLFLDRLKPKFLHRARALPIKIAPSSANASAGFRIGADTTPSKLIGGSMAIGSTVIRTLYPK